MKTAIILVGVSGSGKSTLTNILRALAFGAKQKVAICSADDYFTDEYGNYNFEPTLLGKAHVQCRDKFVTALSTLVDVVICDNTNTTRGERDWYIHEAKSQGHLTFSLVVENTHCEEDIHHVPEEVRLRQAYNIGESLQLL